MMSDSPENNVMRHKYKTLCDADMFNIKKIKDKGLEFFELLQSIGSEPKEEGKPVSFTSRELSLAATKIEEAVMWAVKHITT